MNKKTFFTVLIVIILVVISLLYSTYIPREEEKVTSTTPPVLTFTTDESTELNLDGIHKTNVYVEAVYSNGTVKKRIDTQSGCNALPEKERDGAGFQCYAAGAGYRYKIVRGENSYNIQRKAIEEANPNQTPKTFEYVTVEQFPLMIK